MKRNDVEAKLEGPPWVVLARPGKDNVPCWRVYVEMEPGKERDRTTYDVTPFSPRESPNLVTDLLVQSHHQIGERGESSSPMNTNLLNIVHVDVCNSEGRQKYAEDCCERYARQDVAKIAKLMGMIAVEIDKSGEVLRFAH